MKINLTLRLTLLSLRKKPVSNIPITDETPLSNIAVTEKKNSVKYSFH